jgi:hypothetical protein
MSIMQDDVQKNLVPTKELFESQSEWIEKRDKAIKKLFNGNTNDFLQFLAKIDPLPEWKDAMNVIEAEFSKRKIKSDSKEAVGLTDVIFKRYFPSY